LIYTNISPYTTTAGVTLTHWIIYILQNQFVSYMRTKDYTSAPNGRKMNRHAGRGYHPDLTVNPQYKESGHEHHITTGRCDECAGPIELSLDGSSSGIYVYGTTLSFFLSFLLPSNESTILRATLLTTLSREPRDANGHTSVARLPSKKRGVSRKVEYSAERTARSTVSRERTSICLAGSPLLPLLERHVASLVKDCLSRCRRQQTC
jgi:hypothetical protein